MADGDRAVVMRAAHPMVLACGVGGVGVAWAQLQGNKVMRFA